MGEKVIIAGVGMTPFRKPGQSETYDVMGGKAARAALDDAGIDYSLVEQAYAGYVNGDSCSGQAALYHVGITGIPIFNVNNNCGSGSSAFALAVQAVKSGAVECALAVGFEQMAPGAIEMTFTDRPLPVKRHEDGIAELCNLTEADRKVPPAVRMFGCQVDLVKEEYDLTDEDLAQIAIKARRHAEFNDKAIFRSPLTVEQILEAPPMFRGMRKLFACPPSCGGASVVVCSEAFAKRHGVRTDVQLIGSGWMSDRQKDFEGHPLDLMFRAVSRESALKAYESAGVGPEDIDVLEVHDCFTSNEAVLYDALGLCKKDEVGKFIREGQNSYRGQYVVNPSGGLMAKGHPLGATGLAQITELVQQLRGESGVRQVEGARTALQHNAGLGSAGYVHIFQRQ
jgi:acetyl-CoA acetyltransferase